MPFEKLLEQFSRAVAQKDGSLLADCFCADGIYHDMFYGSFQGREQLIHMLEDRFWRDGKDFFWNFRDAASNDRVGYARWHYFGYLSTMPRSQGRQVVMEGISEFQLRDGLIRHYSEASDTGRALLQLGYPAAALEKVLAKQNRAFLAQEEVLAQRAQLSREDGVDGAPVAAKASSDA